MTFSSFSATLRNWICYFPPPSVLNALLWLPAVYWRVDGVCYRKGGGGTWVAGVSL